METEVKKTRKPRQKKETLAAEEMILRSVESIKSFPEAREIGFETTLFDWRSLIPSKYIEINNLWFTENGIDPSKLSDENKEELKATRCKEEDLIIRLGGFKHLAHVRGIESVVYKVVHSEKDRVSTVCTIKFLPANLTDQDGKVFSFPSQTFSGAANANIENTSYPFSMFLESMAENRSFIRAVKSAFNINILGAEELQIEPQARQTDLLGDEGTVSPQETLSLMIAGGGKTFADLKSNLIKKGWEGQENWNNFQDIPSDQCCLIMEGIRAKL